MKDFIPTVEQRARPIALMPHCPRCENPPFWNPLYYRPSTNDFVCDNAHIISQEELRAA